MQSSVIGSQIVRQQRSTPRVRKLVLFGRGSDIHFTWPAFHHGARADANPQNSSASQQAVESSLPVIEYSLPFARVRERLALGAGCV